MSQDVIDLQDLPSSVNKYTYPQLAKAFLYLSRRPEISSVVIPSAGSKVFNLEMKKMMTWQIYHTYANVPGINNMNNSFVKIMLYSRKREKDTHINNKVSENTVVNEITKQRQELEVQLNNKNTENIEEIKKAIEIKNKMIEKLIRTEKDNTGDTNHLNHQQMASVARRVFEIMSQKTGNIDGLYKEFCFLDRPVRKDNEDTGGNYVLKNTEMDRKIKIESNWKNRASKQDIPSEQKLNTSFNNNINENTKSKKYVPAFKRNSEDESKKDQSVSKTEPSKYVPVFLRKSNVSHDVQSNKVKFNRQPNNFPRWDPQKKQLGQNNNFVRDSEFVSIDNIEQNIIVDTLEEFPSLISSVSKTTIMEQTKQRKEFSRTSLVITKNTTVGQTNISVKTENNTSKTSTLLQKISEEESDDLLDGWTESIKTQTEQIFGQPKSFLSAIKKAISNENCQKNSDQKNSDQKNNDQNEDENKNKQTSVQVGSSNRTKTKKTNDTGYNNSDSDDDDYFTSIVDEYDDNEYGEEEDSEDW
ncbi:MAG: hypothetical protein Dasosvirus9_9 [Dasosvirus sp.]|uniref:Uncharacterized protein n=1 Tax=Dasosvirus sp. TaxID=2487764 RepID=A0A3G4ZRU1_9VIRU|nr:MAG: hypothetical protein Dasosvirus9_9 [Dasosvirus sp.]